MSSADRYAALVAAKRPIYNDKALPDTCQVRGQGTPVVDSTGNETYPEVTLATVRCQLRTGGFVRPSERAVADQVQAVAPYAIDLPYGTAVDASNRIIVNSTREFEIVGVLTPGLFGINTSAVVEERT